MLTIRKINPSFLMRYHEHTWTQGEIYLATHLFLQRYIFYFIRKQMS